MGEDSRPLGWLTAEVEKRMMEPKPEKTTFCSKTSPFGPSYSGEQWAEEEEEETGLRYFSSSDCCCCCCSSFGKVTKSWEKGNELHEVPVGGNAPLEEEVKPVELFPLPDFLALWLVPWLEDFLLFTSDRMTSEVSLLLS